jgi:2-oxoacid:acceptor oxidoreductase delta subunit (pyruvate/2-ketoisovalerate family)
MVCLESREEMPAFPEEVVETEAEGIEILPSAMPLRITSDGGKVRKVEFIKANLDEPKSDGSLNPIPIRGTEFSLEADSVITAIGEAPDLSFLPQEIPIRRGFIEADEMGFVHVKGFFAGGDTIHPVHTVTGAIGSGKKTALAIHEYLQGRWSREKFRMIQVGGKGTISLRKYFHPPEGEANPPIVPFQELHTEHFEHRPRISIPKISVDERQSGFQEVNPGMRKEEAIEEASRCFNCGVCNGCDNCWVYCPDMAVKRKKGRYEIDYDYCKGCGICFEECPRSAILLEEEGR